MFHFERAGRMLGVTVLLFLTSSPASSQLLINELRPLSNNEFVELYNAGSTTIDLSDYYLRTTATDSIDFPSGTVLPGAYVDIDFGSLNVFTDLGGETSVIDRTTGGLVDNMSYGINGSAPLPSQSSSIARAPDASAGAVPAGDPDTDGLVWTIAFSPSPGSANAAPTADLGNSLRLNEFEVFPASGADRIELYNPTGSPIDLFGWTIFVAGRGPFPLPNVVVPATESEVFSLPGGLDLEDTDLVYMFDAAEVRVDQAGFNGAPPSDPSECFARVPDGEGSALGYTFATSDLTLLECSIGDRNEPPLPATEASWRRVKSLFGDD